MIDSARLERISRQLDNFDTLIIADRETALDLLRLARVGIETERWRADFASGRAGTQWDCPIPVTLGAAGKSPGTMPFPPLDLFRVARDRSLRLARYIQIVADPSLEADRWQVRDPVSGQVIFDSEEPEGSDRGRNSIVSDL